MLHSDSCDSQPSLLEFHHLHIFQPGFYGDAGLRSIVETFIIEYFKSYDGDEPTASRKNLVAAYDDSNVSTVARGGGVTVAYN